MEDRVNSGAGREIKLVGHRTYFLGYLKRTIVTWRQLEIPAEGDRHLTVKAQSEEDPITYCKFLEGSRFIRKMFSFWTERLGCFL